MSRRAGERWHRVVAWAVGHARAVVLAFCVLALVAGGYAALNLRIDTSTTDMIAPEVPFRHHAIYFVEVFPQFDQPLVAVIEGRAVEQTEAAAVRLAERLRSRPERFEAVEYLPGEPFFVRHGLLYLETDQLERLSERLAEAQPLLAVLAADPSLRGLAEVLALAVGEGAESDEALALDRLLSAMAETVGAVHLGEPGSLSWRQLVQEQDEAGVEREVVLVQPRLDHASLSPADEAVAAVRRAAEEVGVRQDQGLRLRLTGDAMLQQEELESVRGNAALAAVITTIGVSILLVVGLGSWRLIVPVLATLAVGLLLTAAAALLLIGRLNLISVTFAVLFIGLGVDFGIHLALRVREVLATGAARDEAVVGGSAQLAPALSLSALTAALGFLAFVPTEYRGLAELGVISAGGMAIALVTSLTLLPALLALIRPERLAADPLPEPRPGAFVIHRPKMVLPVALLLGAVAALALPRVGFDFDPLNLKDPDSESVQTFQLLARDPATSPYTIDIVALADDVPDLVERLRAVPEVGSVVSLDAFVPEDQETKLEILESLAYFLLPVVEPGDRPELDVEARQQAFTDLLALAEAPGLSSTRAGETLASALRRFADDRPDDGRLRRLERALTGNLPDLLERLRLSLGAGPVEVADLPPDLVARWHQHGLRRLMVRPAQPITSKAELREFADAVLRVTPSATGAPVIVRQAGLAVLNAFQTASWVALTSITLVLLLVLRNALDVLLVLLPIVLAVLYTAGSAVALGLELNFANVIVLPLLLGLGVSGAIHVVLRARTSVGGQVIELSSTPRAVLFSALTTIASFGSLAISDHRGLASMGQLLTIAILWSLVCTLIVLPNLLAVRRIWSARR